MNILGQTCENGDLVAIGSKYSQYLALVVQTNPTRIVYISSFNMNKLTTNRPLFRNTILDSQWIKVDPSLLNEEQRKQYETIREHIKTID